MRNPGPLNRHRIALPCALLALAFFGGTARALEPDQLLLIVNARAPEGRELAELYVKARGVPEGRIVELDLPFPAEQMTRAAYDADVVPRVREFIAKNGLRQKVACAVTFYGVPIRVEGRNRTPEDEKEAATLDAEMSRLEAELTAEVDALEKLAALHNPAFKPAAVAAEPKKRAHPLEWPYAAVSQALGKRADAAMAAAIGGIAKITDAKAKQDAASQARDHMEKLAGPLEAVLKLMDPRIAAALGAPVDRAEAERSMARLKEVQRELAERAGAPGTSPADVRELIRNSVREHLGSFKLLVLLAQQRQVLETRQSESAFDSELALLWWNGYPVSGWQLNPMHHAMGRLKAPPIMMVTRLDGPGPDLVRQMIETSVKVEQEGLSGNVVLDARGIAADANSYGKYDQTIRDLGKIVRTKTQLPLIIDDKDPVLVAGSAKDAAVYCGWYSLRNYVPGVAFKPGAVGFHIASAELVSLRGENERGWVRNLLNDGVVASVGPVAEPYLHSFPAADEFFPLLMTGRLTLAETYWKTSPLTSWMNTCVGDPLYNPFKAKPALKVEELPEKLAAAMNEPAKDAGKPGAGE